MPEESSIPDTLGETPRKSRAKSLVMTLLKFGIAVFGIWWVIHNSSWNDTATIGAGTEIRNVLFPKETTVGVVREYSEPVLPGNPGQTKPREMVRVRFPDSPVPVVLDPEGANVAVEVVIDEHTRVPGGELNLPREMDLSREKIAAVHEGLHSILIHASSRWYLLVEAWALLVIPFLISAIRWRGLLRPQGVVLPFSKCLQLTFVGQFYSIILPGVTGGDLIKIIYAARLIGSKTKSLITVLLDRVLGLIALMTITAASAGIQLMINRKAGMPLDETLLNVFLLIMGMLVLLALGAMVYFSRRLRKLVGIDWFMRTFASTTDPAAAHHQHDKLEGLFRAVNLLALVGAILIGSAAAFLHWHTHGKWAETHGGLLAVISVLMAAAAVGALLSLVLHARIVDRLMPVFVKGVAAVIRVDETLHTYRGHFGLLAWAFLISIPSQLTTPLSAWLAGMAFGIHMNVAYYMAYVPVAVLAASLPISPPQGFGIMDYIVFHFFVERGTARASQALALAQSIRFLPILWNILGGYWVVTGTYSRHQAEAEAKGLE